MFVRGALWAPPCRCSLLLLLLPPLLMLLTSYQPVRSEVLTPPYFNLAEGRRITATATCGEGIQGAELYCKLVGANSERNVDYEGNLVIQGQVCDHCDKDRPDKAHPPENAVDGQETWWQSPPLSRGMKYNEINLTIDLGQEFHVAYVVVKMGNSPRPGVWVLERSADYGQTYQPWQYFADTVADCESYFGKESTRRITSDDSVICDTSFSKIVPLENGEIFVKLLSDRPSANNFFNSFALQEFTRATNVRFRLLRVKNLLGHLMPVARQDPTTTRRYFYSIKDVSIGGRCRCNGHADLCDITDPTDSYKLICRCQHNTCGHNCEMCCPGFEQKAWSQSKYDKLFECEPCNCYGHSETCVYDNTTDEAHLSIDMHGRYEGGGVCKNCRDHTTGINCNQCDFGFYRPVGKLLNETDVCQPCNCNFFYSNGNCSEGLGKCECKEAFASPDCDRCNVGYYGYPDCKPCECFLDGTRGRQCEDIGGQCPCKQNFGGKFCYQCADGFYNFPECKSCECNEIGSRNAICDQKTGQCLCHSSFGNLSCNQCNHGYYGFPSCSYCNCDLIGSLPEICDKNNGQCLCKKGYAGPRCDKCSSGYNGYPNCKPCGCSESGSASSICDASGICPCLTSFAGRTCEQCSPGYYQYPECKYCNCNSQGSIGVSCDNEGKCKCKPNFMGTTCDQCKEGLYNFPLCEECNCNPAGILSTFAGCGSLPFGELCQCKPRVHGRICDECRELYWNLQPTNPEGCQECDCFMPGVLSGVGVCNPKSGQCVCKPSATSRRCDECSEGFYSLNENSLFGCTECGCNVGGSVNDECDKNTGQCFCQPRIVGRACTEPIQAHYFPTLHQFLYEAEDGRTPAYTPVRYGFDEVFFPEYSWKGYAVFSQLQSEIVHELNIDKPSIYLIVLKYVNPNNETIIGLVSVTPETPNNINIEQKFMVQFKPTKIPTFVTVSGATGNIPSPFVMNPGRWAVTIKIEQNLFVDYFVILPAKYYEGDILVDKVLNPCVIDNIEDGLCRHFDYPSISKFDQVKSSSALAFDGEEPTDFFEDSKQLDVLGVPKLPVISETQPELKLDLTVNSYGPYVILINYMTPSSIQMKAVIEIEVDEKMNSGKAILYACHHTTLCRQATVDATGKVAIFNINKPITRVTLKGGKDHSRVGIESIVALPLDKWSLDYINPNPSCIKKDGKCVQSFYPTPPETKKVEFKNGNEARLATTSPKHIFDNTTSLIILDHEDSIVDLAGKVPSPGAYVFIVHFYQPDFPAFEMNALIHNGQTYEAILPVKHCPSNSGCRSVVKQADGNTQFHLTENFLITLKEPNHKSVWLEYVLVVPAEEYKDLIIMEQPFDYTGLFISKCGSNHFYINTSTTGFCKEATFSLTTAYNSGALPCLCDSDGSLSYVCDPFGGQCQCRPNVIGRRCDACKTGYFGFPECKSCDCPSVATCETSTGECICPPRVVGKNCDQCEPMTYGFDPIIGCEECKCHNFGVKNGNLQCDLFNGSCECKKNIVGRSCDHCRSGYWSFPGCYFCDCDPRGTTPDVCNQETSDCFCKPNVDGQACDLCKDGTFNIQENNEDGCSKCFCFGKTNKCQSSTLYKSEITDIENWSVKTINVTSKLISIEDVKSPLEKVNEGVLSIDLTSKEFEQKLTYFTTSKNYLGNQIKSYGGLLKYSIQYTSNYLGSAVSGPDVILYGHETYLVYFALEQPASSTLFSNFVEIVEQNFIHLNGLSATREQIMQVLQDLKGIYIRATYWEPTVTTRISNISLDTAQEEYIPSKEIALSVEHCQCPVNYVGLSCEECADGYYRAQTGPYGGFCVACQCNGHSSTCDKVTGICNDCEHNTIGDHCEKCIVGYYGNATIGLQDDCLICACPLPIASNNFATGCEVSTDGNKISCDCIPGYFGARCESCNAGFYGSPETPGEVCKECQCSGNINKNDQGSCDSITGKCTRCLNNTFGESCQYCRPGFFGDAVNLKDCQQCDCDKCGMEKCDSYDGICVCQPNVEGEKCDRCAVNHYGFGTCKGCKLCECALASESSQCDDNTGMCRCKPGVAGRMCDRCKPGYWNYTEEGCISCGCNSEYSIGVSCNPQTGQCECLPGVIGDKCDHCPHRWVLIQPNPNIDQMAGGGCFECDTCTHSLLDVTDSLFTKLYPISKEFETVALGYFTAQRLLYINDTISKLQPNLTNLVSNSVSSYPLNEDLFKLQNEVENINRKSKSALSDAVALTSNGDLTFQNAKEISSLMDEAVSQTNIAVIEVTKLAQSLQEGAGPQIDLALTEAQQLKDSIMQLLPNEKEKYEIFKTALLNSDNLKNKMKEFEKPLEKPLESLMSLKLKIKTFQHILAEIKNYTDNARNNSNEAESIISLNRESLMKQNNRINTLTKLKDTANNAMENLMKTVKEANNDLDKTREAFATLNMEFVSMRTIKSKVNDTITNEKIVLDELQIGVDKAKEHSDKLKEQADMMEFLIKNSTVASETAIAAANSYKNIVAEIEKSLNLARNASITAEDTINKAKGLNERVASTEENSVKLQQDVKKAIEQEQDGLEESLQKAKDEFSKISILKSQINERENEINKQLDQISLENPNIKSDENVKQILENSDNGEKSNQLISNLDNLVKSLPNHLTASQKLNEDIEKTLKDNSQTSNQLDLAASILPNAIDSVNRLKDKPEALQKKAQRVKDDIVTLRKKIDICRELVNKIKVGVSIAKNSTIELRNPKNLAQQGINTLASIYFKTDQPTDGLIMYLGNEVGTSQRMRRAKTDDFMALQIQSGVLVLLMDIGSGIETVVSNKTVTDNKWYKATIERTGKIVKLIVHEDVGNSKEFSYENEIILSGNSSILNLDKDHSKLFIGGLPDKFIAQQGIVDQSIEGQVEELMLGDTFIGFWNSVDSSGAKNGSDERNKFTGTLSAPGYRMNGNGVVVLDSKFYSISSKTSIILRIKTTATDGLIFLAFKDNTFMSIELERGSIVYRINLGGNTTKFTTYPTTYNDDKWHLIDVRRDGKMSLLNVDETEIQKGACDGPQTSLKVPDFFYVGGYQGEDTINEVNTIGFNGCLDHIQINRAQINLNNNVNAHGISTGCFEKVVTIVSFETGSRGYVRWPEISVTDNLIYMIFRFKTKHANGLLIYSQDGSSVFSLRMESGILTFSCGGIQVSSTQATRYDDDIWHVVYLGHTDQQLQLLIDDYDAFHSELSPSPVRFLKTDFFFGGVPSDVDAAAAFSPSFAGCIGDVTFNGKKINFAQLIDRPGVTMDQCIDSSSSPTLKSPNQRFKLPLKEDSELTTVSSVKTDLSSTISPDETTKPPIGLCVLSANPQEDKDITKDSGFRFGNMVGSRMEFDSSVIKNKSNKIDMSVEVKTIYPDGIIFFTHDSDGTHIMAIYLKDGRVHFQLNCNSIPILIVAQIPINDGKWHSIGWIRSNVHIELFVDGISVGNSSMDECNISTNPLFYLGGTNPVDNKRVIQSVDINSTFVGCLRKFKLYSKDQIHSGRRYGVSKCSEKVEEGGFFHGSGGYIKLFDKFSLGKEINISMEIKPRSVDGILVAMLTKKNFLILEMKNGSISFSVDTGKGSISTSFTPASPYFLCDGQWHRVTAEKKKNIVKLGVDNMSEIGSQESNKPPHPLLSPSSQTLTKPLFIGGHPQQRNVPSNRYMGCIRKVEIFDNLFVKHTFNTFSAQMVTGNVTLSVCPTI